MRVHSLTLSFTLGLLSWCATLQTLYLGHEPKAKVVTIQLMVIDGYFINEYWWLLMAIILVFIDDYFINGYW